MTEYGYVRVSTREQNEARQLDAMRKYGILDKNIIHDRQSGKNFDRPGFKQLIKKMKPGDILVVKSIDRLGRNYGEILEQWRYLTKERHASVVVLDMPLLDTRTDKDLTGELISDFVLQLLSYVAETERQFIHQRQAEGIQAAKERGVQFGRSPLPKPPEFEELRLKWLDKKISSREAAKELNISHGTFLNWIHMKRV